MRALLAFTLCLGQAPSHSPCNSPLSLGCLKWEGIPILMASRGTELGALQGRSSTPASGSRFGEALPQLPHFTHLCTPTHPPVGTRPALRPGQCRSGPTSEDMQTGHRRPPPSTLPPAGLKDTGHLTTAADCLRRDCEPRQPAATAYEEQWGAARGGGERARPPRSGGAGSDGVGRCLQPGSTDPFLQELEEVQEAAYRRCGWAGSCTRILRAAAVPASQLDAPCAGWPFPDCFNHGVRSRPLAVGTTSQPQLQLQPQPQPQTQPQTHSLVACTLAGTSWSRWAGRGRTARRCPRGWGPSGRLAWRCTRGSWS